MSSDPQPPDELQKMLALKRHEAPPAPFFRNFSERVLDRLNTPEPPPPPTLRRRLGLDIDSRPVLVCASGVLVCGLLVVGLIGSLRVAPPSPLPRPADQQTYLIFTPQPSVTPAPVPVEDPASRTAAALPVRVGDPVSVPPASPFTSLASPATSPVAVSKPSSGKEAR